MKKEIVRRETKQKAVILEELRKVTTHPTADTLFKMARRRLPALSFGTVYRNLNLLRDQGKILELVRGRYSSRYDGDTRNHYHFFCLSCNKVFDIDESVSEVFDKKVSQKTGFIVKYHHIDFYGYCSACKNKIRGGN